MNFLENRQKGETLFPATGLPKEGEAGIFFSREGPKRATAPAPGMGWRYGPPRRLMCNTFPDGRPLTVWLTVRGRFFPSGAASAQEFSHEPACQTGYSAPQGRFHHQSEQAFHLSHAWQCASFSPSGLCSERRPRFRPARGGTGYPTHSVA